MTISTSALLANDIDIDGASLSITAVSGAVGITGLALNADGTVSFTSGNTTGANAGSFSYTVFDGAGGAATGTVSIEVLGVSNGNGTDTVDLTGASYDASYIDGREGADEVTGNAGGDIFLGGSGNGADTLKGSDGNDLLVGGDGNDSLAGGAGKRQAICKPLTTASHFHPRLSRLHLPFQAPADQRLGQDQYADRLGGGARH